MPPRILIFVAVDGGEPRAAAGAACEAAEAGTARTISLDGLPAAASVRAEADRLAETLDLRPVATELAVLAQVTELLREEPWATVVIDAPAPDALTRLLAAADLARARLDAGRPDAGVSTLAAVRLAATPGLATLRGAAAAGDLLRAPELTSTGIVAGSRTGSEAMETARIALAAAGLTVAPLTLPARPVAAASTLAATGGTAALDRDPAPAVTATEHGAELRWPLPAIPDDLRAVRSGSEIALHAAGVTRRFRAPAALGALRPGEVEASDDGTLTVRFDEPGAAA